MHIVASKDLKRNAIFSLDMLEMRLSSSARNTDSLRLARSPHDAANVIDREPARGWGGAASAPRDDARGGTTGENAMRAILALGLLIALSAAADAATVHHRRHAVVSPNHGYTQSVRSGFAYAPAGPPIQAAPYNDYNEPYPGASQGYAPGEKERFLDSVRSGG
jgi:hypothetical protein